MLEILLALVVSIWGMVGLSKLIPKLKAVNISKSRSLFSAKALPTTKEIEQIQRQEYVRTALKYIGNFEEKIRRAANYGSRYATIYGTFFSTPYSTYEKLSGIEKIVFDYLKSNGFNPEIERNEGIVIRLKKPNETDLKDSTFTTTPV